MEQILTKLLNVFVKMSNWQMYLADRCFCRSKPLTKLGGLCFLASGTFLSSSRPSLVHWVLSSVPQGHQASHQGWPRPTWKPISNVTPLQSVFLNHPLLVLFEFVSVAGCFYHYSVEFNDFLQSCNRQLVNGNWSYSNYARQSKDKAKSE